MDDPEYVVKFDGNVTVSAGWGKNALGIAKVIAGDRDDAHIIRRYNHEEEVKR